MNSTSITDKKSRPIHISFEKTDVTAHAGSPFLLEAIKRSPLFKSVLPLFETLTGRNLNPLNYYTDEDLLLQFLLMFGLDRSKLSDARLLKNDPLIDDLVKDVASAATLSRYLDKIDERCHMLRSINGCPETTDHLPKYDPERIGCQFFDGVNDLLLDSYLDILEQQFKQNKLIKGMPYTPFIIVDADSTFLEVYGQQEESAYCGKNRANGYFPLVVYIEGMPVHIQNAPGATDGRKLLENCLGGILSKIKSRFPTAKVLLRADAGFNSSRIVKICEQYECYYLIGFGQNNVLIDQLCKQLRQQAQEGPITNGLLERLSGEMMRELEESWTLTAQDPENLIDRTCGVVKDYQATTWDSERKLFYRIQDNRLHREVDYRFVETNLTDKLLTYFSEGRGHIKGLTNTEYHFDDEASINLAIEAYDGLYCDRAHCELNIHEFKEIKSGVELSCHGFFANWTKLMFVAIIQHIVRRWQLLACKNNECGRNSSISTLRKWLFNLPAKVCFYARRVEIKLNMPRYGFDKIWLAFLNFSA